MALPATGTITAAMVNVELGRASNAPFSLNDPAVRALAGKTSGAISFADLRGKSAVTIVVTITPTGHTTTSSTTMSAGANYTVSVTKNGSTVTPSAQLWTFLGITAGSGDGSISGSTLTTANLSITCFNNQMTTGRFQCRVTVDGVFYTQTCTKTHTYTGVLD